MKSAAELLAVKDVLGFSARKIIDEELRDGIVINTTEYDEAVYIRESSIARTTSKGVTVIGCFDDDYPDVLRRLSSPPLVLYARGDVGLLSNRRRIAVIGTRSPGFEPERGATRRFIESLEPGTVVISGMALGCDTIGHEEAIRRGLPTIAVIGSGLSLKGQEKRALIARAIVSAGGLVISELENSTPVSARGLMSRNRIIVGLCDLVFVSEVAGDSKGTWASIKLARSGEIDLKTPDHGNDGSDLLLRTPERELPGIVPSFSSPKTFVDQLGDKPLATAI